jgi:hypothetical protein
MSKNSFLVIFLLVSFKLSSKDVSIEIDISEQRLYLIEGLDIKGLISSIFIKIWRGKY